MTTGNKKEPNSAGEDTETPFEPYEPSVQQTTLKTRMRIRFSKAFQTPTLLSLIMNVLTLWPLGHHLRTMKPPAMLIRINIHTQTYDYDQYSFDLLTL